MVARRGVEVSIARLPATGRELFGREAELAWLDACWAEEAHVAVVVAWGGVGKSALVNTWLARMRDDGWRGAERVYGWSFYSQGTDRLTSSDEFVDAALRWFGDGEPEKGSPWEKGERLAALVRRERAILVLDGVEPLQWGPTAAEPGRLKDVALTALVKDLGAQNQGLCVITSRLAVADLEALGGDKVRAEDLGHLSPEAGAELLEARGARGAVGELRVASEEYGGHSLALTLLGTYLRKAHGGDIRKRGRIPAHAGKPVDRMMAAYERWFADKPELAILRMLGLFDRPAHEDEIAAVRAKPAVAGLTDWLEGVGDAGWNQAVTALRDVGLLAASEGADRRLDAHPLVREHFGERLKQEQPAAWREGHRRLYEHLKATAKELPETLEEMAPLYAAVVHGCLAGKNSEALDEIYRRRLQRGYKEFSSYQLGAFGAELAALSAFFDPPWERLAPGLSQQRQAYVLNEAGVDLGALGRPADAITVLRMGLTASVALEDWRSASNQARNISGLALACAELTDALAYARQGVELADRSGDALWRLINRAMVAATLHAMGQRTEAAVRFREAEALQNDRQPMYPLLYSLQGFRYCDLLLDAGRETEVRQRAGRTLNWATTNGGLLDIALDHVSLGRAHLLAAQRDPAADLAPAADHLRQAVDGLRRAGQQDYLPLGLLARAALHTHTRDFAGARRDLDDALDLATRCGFRLHEADAHVGYARLHLAEGHPAPAREHLAKARALIDDTGYHRRDGELAELEAEAAAMAAAQPPEPVVTAATPTPPPPRAPRIAKPMPNLPAFPQPILDAYRERKLAILFGSGLSIAKDVGGDFPRWNELPHRFLDHVEKHCGWTPPRLNAKRASFPSDLPLTEMLAELDVLQTALKGVRKYQPALNALFRPANAAPGDVHRALVALEIAVLATTNYDELLEHTEGPPKRSAYTWRDADNALTDIAADRKVLFKVHGSAEREDTIVMTRREYDDAARDPSYQRIMSHLLQGYTFLLVGYGVNNPLDLDLVFGLNAGAFGVAARTHYALVRKDLAAAHRDRWQRDMNIQTVPYDDHGDLAAILRVLAKAPRNPP